MLKTISAINNSWATCSPVNFRGCEIYANRDAGLVGMGFRAIGEKCNSILLEPSKEGDLPNIIRATRTQMENPVWWSGIAGRGVVFYNCLKFSHAPVLHAAKAAGLPIAINVDSAAIFDFHTNPHDFWQKAIMHKSHVRPAARLTKAFAGVIKSYYRKSKGRNHRLASHLAIADVIGGVTPDAVARLRRFLDDYGQPDAAGRVHLIPHPAHPRFVMRGEKSNDGNITFVTVGRWNDHVQKRPDLLMRVIDSLLSRDPRAHFRVYGGLIPEMEQWHSRLAPEPRRRVGLYGIVPNSELLDAYQNSHVYLCVSAYESFLIAAAEAMCCGCSIVACNSPVLPGPKWFGAEARGTLSDRLTAQDLADAAVMEADAWRTGQRDATKIALWGQQHMHANRVAESYAGLLAQYAE